MSFHHLPPPTDHRSPPASNKSPTSAHPPHPPQQQQQQQQQHPSPPSSHPAHRRPWTPSSLRDVNLSPNNAASRNFNYPSPPTGHDLMAMFPPNPPPTFMPGPTSGYFHSQERAFFSRAADNSLVRVQIDIDMPIPAQPSTDKGKARAVPVTLTHRQSTWTPSSNNISPPHAQPHHAPSAAPSSSNHRPQTIPINTIPVGPPQSSPPTHQQSPHKIHISTHTPPDVKPKQQESTMIIIHDTDESWKKPIPYSERRRAGKQPKRRSD